ncbi:helix-turn-helix transcriptional regulator [Flavobacterium sp. LPB0248]|uniref:helix-turn-helix domain-containing protein n=1 Tax=Flavobacterium sp. LPB0248 TaxID=2614441 RepID=UPI0015A5419D|nr:AraC family transcriptional regulator [Flavobacterium sp. LPB0248]QLC64835.1 helix-turn-helix transcriptional regulator [Flavobacterium sp. LPB0248]
MDDGYLNYRISVHLEFSEVFTHFYYAENTTDSVIKKTLLPTFQTILAFSFGCKATLISKENTEISLDRCLVLGPIKKAFEYALDPGSKILVATFKNDSFYRFFGSVSQGKAPFDPDDLLIENCFSFLWQEIAELDSAEEKVNFILNFCRPYLKSPNAISAFLTDFNNEAQNPIKAVSEMSQLTERAIQYQHKKLFGFSAKEKMRYLRFLKAICYIQNTSEKINWFDVINECGYYDQSQLIHDFKHYVNASPNQYLKFQQDICSGNI